MIKNKIGEPTVLEQLAEECCELAQISLKKARILRKENSKKIEEINSDLLDGIADVLNCISIVTNGMDIGIIIDKTFEKLDSWKKRIGEN